MGPINSAYTPGLAVRAFIVGSGFGILRLFAVGEKDVLTLYGVQKVRHFLNAGGHAALGDSLVVSDILKRTTGGVVSQGQTELKK